MEPPAITANAAIETPRTALWRAFVAEAEADLPLLAIIAAYIAAVWGVCAWLGKPEFYHPTIYMSAWLSALASGLGLYLFVIELPQAVRESPRAPLTALIARLRRLMTPRFVAGIVLFIAAGLFTGAFTTAKSLINALTPFHADPMLARLDASLHFGVDPWRLLQPVLGHHLITRAIQNLYLSGWGTLLMGFSAAVAFWPRLTHIRNRFFLTYFAAWIVLGNVLAALFMSGGPVYFGDITGDHARFAEQIRYLAFSDGMENSSVKLQHTLWRFYAEGRVHIGTGISAFPSLHVAMVTLFTLTAFEIDKRLGWLIGALALTIFLGSVHLGWHYAVDGYVSAAFVLAVWFGLRRVLKPAA